MERFYANLDAHLCKSVGGNRVVFLQPSGGSPPGILSPIAWFRLCIGIAISRRNDSGAFTFGKISRMLNADSFFPGVDGRRPFDLRLRPEPFHGDGLFGFIQNFLGELVIVDKLPFCDFLFSTSLCRCLFSG